MTIAALRAARAKAVDVLIAERDAVIVKMKAISAKEKKDFKTGTDDVEFDRLAKEVEAVKLKITATEQEFDAEIKRAQTLQDIERDSAKAVGGQDSFRVPAEVNKDPYTSEAAAVARGLVTSKGLIVGGFAKALLMAGGQPFNAVQAAKQAYGENHPVTVQMAKALQAGVGASGGFIVPPDYVNEIIDLLRPRSVVRAAMPRSLPMPRGTMTLPAQTAAATASYGNESGQAKASQPSLGPIVATYKKLTGLVPVTNDLMRYADPAADAFVRDDLVKVMALREDLAFLTGDGTQDTPKGFLGFANMWAAATAGTVGRFSSTANSVGAVGGNFITSTEGASVTLTTVANELGGLVNKLDTANVPDIRRKWFFHPRIFNYLNNLLNSLGIYVYRDELSKGTLLGYPFAKSTQIPINLNDASSANSNCTFIMLVEIDDALLLDSMTLELAISREGTYYDANGQLVSAFQNDQTLVRAIAEHDFQMRHQASIAVDQFVTWTPAIG